MRILRYERRDEGSTPSEPATGAVGKGYFVCRRFEPCFRCGGIAQPVEQQCPFRLVALLFNEMNIEHRMSNKEGRRNVEIGNGLAFLQNW